MFAQARFDAFGRRDRGQKMSADIVKYRPYTTFKDLETKLAKDFPAKTIQKIEPMLSL